PIWAHQEFTRFPPVIAVPVSTEGAKVNTVYDPGVPSSLNSGINAATPFPPRFHPNLPDQGPLALWTFNGTLPPKLLIGRYGEGIIFRHSNKLPFDITQNGGFGIHTFSFTAQNVYKGDAGMFNIYSALDRGNEAINDGVNLRLPSGTAKDFGNLDYDVNLMLADKAWDANGQLHFDIFDTESGFVGD